ncbi:MAG: Holliday junction branch migration protein RuvA [Thermodesulfobacteriota bacterium]
MIAALTGVMLAKSQERAVIDVHGVGYEVFVDTDTLARLPALGDEVFVHIHTHVREDAIVLFGFLEEEDREMFLILKSVSGVGPKLAMSILSGMRVAPLCQAIVNQDIKSLTGLQGIGKKTAERLCVDLKDKVAHLAGSVSADHVGGGAVVVGGGSILSDVLSALVNLGYQDPVAREALVRVKKRLGEDEFNGLGVEEMIREALRTLA